MTEWDEEVEEEWWCDGCCTGKGVEGAEELGVVESTIHILCIY